MTSLDASEYLIKSFMVGFKCEKITPHSIEIASDLMNALFVCFERIDNIFGHQELLDLVERHPSLNKLFHLTNGLSCYIIHDHFQITLHIRTKLFILV